MNRSILGVDIGTVRIGLAICEDVSLPAMPLCTIEHTSRAQDIAVIIAIAKERAARMIAVGYPLRLDGTKGKAAEGIDRFIAALSKAFDGEVVKVDERLTTAAATKKLASSELSGSKRRRIVDRLAAVEILESYRAAARRSS